MLLSRDIDALQKSMRDTRNNVEARGVQLEEQSEKLESQIRQADDKLGEVAETLDTLNRAAHLSNADFGVQLERMLQELKSCVEPSNSPIIVSLAWNSRLRRTHHLLHRPKRFMRSRHRLHPGAKSQGKS